MKGYEFQKNRYVLLEDSDFDSVKVESSTLMTVEKFVDTGSIDPIYYDSSYYVAPDGKGSDDVYAVLREAISPRGPARLPSRTSSSPNESARSRFARWMAGWSPTR